MSEYYKNNYIVEEWSKVEFRIQYDTEKAGTIVGQGQYL